MLQAYQTSRNGSEVKTQKVYIRHRGHFNYHPIQKGRHIHGQFDQGKAGRCQKEKIDGDDEQETLVSCKIEDDRALSNALHEPFGQVCDDDEHGNGILHPVQVAPGETHERQGPEQFFSILDDEKSGCDKEIGKKMGPHEKQVSGYDRQSIQNEDCRSVFFCTLIGGGTVCQIAKDENNGGQVKKRTKQD